MESKPKITLEEFIEATSKVEITIGHIFSVETLEVKNKTGILKLQVDFNEGYGSKVPCLKQVITNIGDKFTAEQLVDKFIPFVTNLEPRKTYGHMSQAMIFLGTNPFLEELEIGYSAGQRLM